MNTQVNWADLPNDILFLIAAGKHTDVVDSLRLAAVCVSWRSIYTDKLKNASPQPPVQLIVPTKHHNNLVCDLSDQSLYQRDSFSLSHTTVWRGSDHGWLVVVFQNREIQLLNPLQDNEIIKIPRLPCRDKSASGHSITYLRKAVLSANPSENQGFIVMALQHNPNHRCRDGSSLFFWKNGDEGWTPAPKYNTEYDIYKADDIIYYKDKFYASLDEIGVFVLDVSGPSIGVSLNEQRYPIDSSNLRDKRYIVESCGELLQIVRYTCGFRRRITHKLEVFKLDQIKNLWIRVTDLGDRILFIGDNYSSFSLPTSDMPGCKPNNVYFIISERGMTGKNKTYFDIGVYNLKDHNIKPLLFPINREERRIAVAPIFMQSTLRFKSNYRRLSTSVLLERLRSVLEGSFFKFAILILIILLIWVFSVLMLETLVFRKMLLLFWMTEEDREWERWRRLHGALLDVSDWGPTLVVVPVQKKWW